MNEMEWLECTDPTPMLEFLRGKISERKLRLFAVACVQRYSMVDGAMRQIIRTSELYADGLANWTDLASVRKMAKELQRQAMQRNVGMGAGAVRNAASVARPSAFAAAQGVLDAVVPDVAIHAIREVIGNPFRPISLNPAWLTWHDGLLASMAQKMYDSRNFTDMPILADALEEAGCTDPDILNHCRQPAEHVRGCWLLDLLLGKE